MSLRACVEELLKERCVTLAAAFSTLNLCLLRFNLLITLEKSPVLHRWQSPAKKRQAELSVPSLPLLTVNLKSLLSWAGVTLGMLGDSEVQV